MLLAGVTIKDGGDWPARVCAAPICVNISIADVASKAIETIRPMNMAGLTLSRVAAPLEAILSWYEGADRRCRDEIFGDVFLLAFRSSAARGLVDFQAYDAEQAFLPGVEHARP